VESGDTISTNYDPMLAKVIAVGSTRADALRKLAAALQTARIDGVTTNRDLLVAILEHEEFAAGRFDNHFLDRHPPAELIRPAERGETDRHLLALALAEQSAARAGAGVWPAAPSGWRNNRSARQLRRYRVNDRVAEVGYQLGRGDEFLVDGQPLDLSCVMAEPQRVELLSGQVRRRFDVEVAGNRAWVSSRRSRVEVVIQERFPVAAMELAAGSLSAPMPGVVVRVDVSEGDRVRAGQPLLYIEAMKMEHPVTAPTAGVVSGINVITGSAVDPGTLLLVIDAEEVDEGTHG
jgi:propionyl-CoA carboxylase alpha chain